MSRTAGSQVEYVFFCRQFDTFSITVAELHSSLLSQLATVSCYVIYPFPVHEQLGVLDAVEVEELRSLSKDDERLVSGIRWADLMLFSVDQTEYGLVRDIIAHARFRLETNFAYAFADTDMLCGFGACLTCVVPTLSGRYTRACMHGPLIALAKLAD